MPKVSKSSSQRFISRDRAPRVQIEYDVQTGGAQRVIQLPFVLGVWAGLSGASARDLPPVSERKFVRVDLENFDAYLEKIRPRVAIEIPDVLAGSGIMNVEITFESYDDFLPGSIAARIPSTLRLLEARNGLISLITYMDGKGGRRT